MIYHFEVTKADIKAAINARNSPLKQHACQMCIVAQALKRTFNTKEVNVGIGSCRIKNDYYTNGPETIKVIRRFDRGEVMEPVKGLIITHDV